jgi:type II secretory ATPase GspE/PulE/Tfp pilus assembly ATPase PilB-like protein
MDADNEIRQLVLRNRSSDEIRTAALKGGMRLLADDGWRLVRLGITTPEEVLRVTKDQNVVSGVEEKSEEAKSALAA